MPSPPPAPVPERLALERGAHAEPHRLLGAHRLQLAHLEKAGRREGVVVRAFHPVATGAALLREGGSPVPMTREGDGGLFVAFVPGDQENTLRHVTRWTLPDGSTWDQHDPYRFLPTVGALDMHLFNEGTHRRPWHALGARAMAIDGVEGVAFSTWAPNAQAVAVTGDFNAWDARLLPMRRLGASGIWEIFVPGVAHGARYKFSILGPGGTRVLKADPFARWAECPPATASRVFTSRFTWSDDAWMARRRGGDPLREPMHAYEVHLGSWRRDATTGRLLSYRELAPRLADHVLALGFTHVELMPVLEHPFDASWGYQVTGYYAPTARHGDPDDFRAFVDEMHRRGVGIILDWVPAHFVKDEWALLRYDGTPIFEHSHPHRGEHPDWGTAIFNLSRHEVRSFLLGSALWWLEELHVDGLRVDAVASMLYLDYSRKAGEWTPNEHGGNENVEAVDFLRMLNRIVREDARGCVTIAEESTSWPGVTAPLEHGGLGFHFKWNMGWMHDTLAYFGREPVHRTHHHDQLTFAMLYETHERFVNPLSHDEVVHGKGSLFARMPGDDLQKLANLRVLFAYMLTRPGKKLLFMGSELAPEHEWTHERELPWDALLDPRRAALSRCLGDLGAFYREHPALWRGDPDPGSFRWIDCHDRIHSVVAYERRSGDDRVVVVLNLTPVPRARWRIGVPEARTWRIALATDELRHGGSGTGAPKGSRIASQPVRWHERAQSVELDLPPLAAIILVPDDPPAGGSSPDDDARRALRDVAARAGIEAEYTDLAGHVRAVSAATDAALLGALGVPADDPVDPIAAHRFLDERGASAVAAGGAPGRCPDLGRRLAGRRALGVTVNAWSLWRRDGWGGGDLSDVARVAEWAAGRGADFLGLSPLHLLRLDGTSVAPYYPSSRRWLHPGLIDVDAVPELEESPGARNLIASRGFQSQLERVRASTSVDHAGSLALKLEALAALHRAFRERHEGRPTARGRAHQAFVADGGEALRDLATYLALDEDQRSFGRHSWRGWDDELRDARSGAVARFRADAAERVAFHGWLQFELDRQLAGASRRALAAGMRLGLLLDLAVGTEPDGADAWREPASFATGASLGAPPDPLGPLGQDWSLAPLNPLELGATGFRAWRDLVRAAMRHAGVLRIDHAFGLVRQFWIPRGRPASEGAYVRQPSGELLRVLAEEAGRGGTIVVGEDLGTPPRDFDAFMRQGGLVSTRLLIFERRDDGSFRAAGEHSDRAMLAFATHDLPPLQGWQAGRDLELRRDLGLFEDDASRDRAWHDRSRDRERLLAALRSAGLLAKSGEPEPAALARAVHELMVASPAPLVALQLDDLVGETEPVNLPGVGPDAWPSWTRRQRVPVDDLADDRFASRAWPRAGS